MNYLAKYLCTLVLIQNIYLSKIQRLTNTYTIHTYLVHMWLVLGKSLKYESSPALSVCESIIQKAKGREERGLRKYLHS